MNELALFAGAGGGILGGKLLGWNTVGAVEIEEHPRKSLLQRQRDGILGKFPIWDDIRTFDGRPWNGAVDIISGGFPCQDISAAGKGAGIEGEKSGLWGEMARVVCEVFPRFVFVENSPMLTSRGLRRVLGDLAEMGYNARWCVLGANDAGAPHRRQRIWILAYSSQGNGGTKQGKQQEIRANGIIRGREARTTSLANTNKAGLQKKGAKQQAAGPSKCSSINWWDYDPAILPDSDKINDYNRGSGTGKLSQFEQAALSDREYWPTESRLGRMAHGVANRVDRLKAIGNGQVPAVAALAFTILSEGLI